MSHYSCSRQEGRRGEVLIAYKSTAFTTPSRSQWKMSGIWFDILRWLFFRDILYVCVLLDDACSLLRITLKSVFQEQLHGGMFNRIFCLFLWIYLGCTLMSVHGDDRIATGSGNISDERFRGEVVTTFGMRCIYFLYICWPHLVRVTLGTAQIKIWHVLSFSPLWNRFYKGSN